ncbi:MAG: hypothetical protein IPP36_07685 [Nitrosomonadales bacterium]|nr:hypothetical protein [Nitrosomonadales bacterium]
MPPENTFMVITHGEHEGKIATTLLLHSVPKIPAANGRAWSAGNVMSSAARQYSTVSVPQCAHSFATGAK